MLIIVSGVQTLNIRAIANEVFFGLNQFKVDDYTVTFCSRKFKIDDSSGATVYSTSFPGVENTTTLLQDEDGFAILEQVQPLLDGLLAEAESWHYSTKFSEDVLLDFGCMDASESEASWPGLFDSLIQQYNDCTHDAMVVSGGFSKSIIDRITNEIGSENVAVVNIVRNPSSAFVCNLRSQEFYTEFPNEYDSHDKRIKQSFLNAVSLKNNGVDTIKIEDITIDGLLTVAGTTVHLPEGSALTNGYITDFESSIIQSQSDELDASLSEFNNVMSDFNHNCIINSEELEQQVIDKIHQLLPENIFTSLGYSPLTYQQVTVKV